MVAANFVALLRVFFAGVLRSNAGMIKSEPRGGSGGRERDNTYLLESRSFEVSDSAVAQR